MRVSLSPEGQWHIALGFQRSGKAMSQGFYYGTKLKQLQQYYSLLCGLYTSVLIQKMSCSGLVKWQTSHSPFSTIELTLREVDWMELSLSWIEMWLTSNQEELGCNQRQINLNSPRSAMVKFLIYAPSFNGLTLNFAYCYRTSSVFLGNRSNSTPLNEVTLTMPGQIFTDKVKFKKQILIIGFFAFLP